MSNLSSTGSSSGSGTAEKPGGVRHVTVSADQAGQRLDNFLMRELKGLPRSRVYRLVRKGEVRVNQGRVDARYRLQGGDRVRIPPVRLAPTPAGPATGHIDTGTVLLEDASLLVLNKPAGIPVHKGTGIAAGMIEALRDSRPELPFLELVHRLDRDTSGCLVLAKNRGALTALHAALRGDTTDTMSKRYTALVRGRFRGRTVPVRAALRRNAIQGGERMVQVSADGDAAESVFRLDRSGETCSRVEIDLVTGRTHQARVHAAHIGYPIAGDRKYGDREFNSRMRRLGVKRLALHARSLVFRHPDSGESCRVEAPLPDMFETVFEDSGR